MKLEFKLLPPLMPNFISYEIPVGKRQDGFNLDANKIPITELTQSQAEEYGELMKQTFIEHWGRRAMQNILPEPPQPPEDRIYTRFGKTNPPPNFNK
jgi:hypothetical protein